MPSRKRYVKDGQIIPTEHQEQATLIKWKLLYQEKIPALKCLIAIPNQGAARLKNLQTEGVLKGVSDLFLACPPPSEDLVHGLWIELKRVKGGKVSAEQYDWLALMENHGYRATIARGANEAWLEIMNYLGEEDPRI
jgi:hypothetical protein